MSKVDQKKLTALKDAGNKAFSANNFSLAVTKFSEALLIDAKSETLLSNRSAAYTKMEQFEDAVADAKQCIALKPEWGKGYVRLGHAYFSKGDFAAAVGAYAQGLAADPENESITEGLQAAQKKLASKKKKTGNKKTQDKSESKDNKQYEPVIGIDLGTTYSCVGIWEDDNVKILSNKHGERTTPSYVSFKKSGERVVGKPAKAALSQRPKLTLFDIKRIIGQRFSDPGVQTDIKRFPFEVIKGADDKPMIKLDLDTDKKVFAPEEISAMVLEEMKQIAEEYLGRAVNKAVITVPAYFNDAQRMATKAAGAIAGLEVLRIINEPTAAALSYGLDNVSKEKEGATNILVFDLGGGTFDVSVLSIEGGVFTVRATGGDTRLGGEDFDNKTVDYLLEEADKQKIDIRGNSKAMQRVKAAAEQAKRQLSSSQSTEVLLDNIVDNKTLTTTLTRAKFEQLNSGSFGLCMDTVKRVLKDSKIERKDIHEIVLVGGSTRIPKIQQSLMEYFDGRALCKSVNPDEAVAYGAAVQGAILSGRRNKKTDDVLLMDVTPLSLGIETTGRVMSVIIPRNTPIPGIKTQTYTTEHNFQTAVDVAVYEGERLQTEFNHLLGEFTIKDIEKAKKGEPQIEVTFAIDSNGILDVKAKDKKTGAEAKIQIANRGQTSSEEVQKMLADAERFRKLDLERTKKIEYMNTLESVIAEAVEVANGLEGTNSRLAGIIRKGIDQAQEFFDNIEEDTPAKDILSARRALEVRIQNKGH